MNRKAQQLELEAAIAAVNDARDHGHMYFQLHDLMLVEVARHAATLYSDASLQIAFLQGYSEARIQHDEWMMESER